MVKFTMKDGNRVMIGIGLTAVDVENLKQHGPQTFPLSSLSLPWPLDLRILYKETDSALMEALTPLMGPETKVEGGG